MGTAWVTALQQREQALARGARIVTVLAGAGQRHGFRAACERSSRTIAQVHGRSSPSELVALWLARLPRRVVIDAAWELAGHATGQGRAELALSLAGYSPAARVRWQESWATTDVEHLAAWLCCLDADGHELSLGAAPLAPLQLASVLAGLAGSSAPAVLIDADEPAGVDACEVAAGLATTFSVHVSGVPVAVAAPGAVWLRYFDEAAESSAKALARQGVLVWPIPVEPPDAPRPPHRPRPPAPSARRADHERAQLDRPHGPDGFDGADGFDRADGCDGSGASGQAHPGVRSSRASPPPDAETAERARSRAEALLYAALQADRRTSDRFEPNALIDAELGGRPAEIDLASRDSRFAVEVDGYHHFRNADDYRRDRRKDVLLQLHGWLVFRVLAEDVIDDAAGVAAAIAAALTSLPKGRASPP